MAEKMEHKNIYRKGFRCKNAAQENYENLMRKLLSYTGFDANPMSQSFCAYNEFKVACDKHHHRWRYTSPSLG